MKPRNQRPAKDLAAPFNTGYMSLSAIRRTMTHQKEQTESIDRILDAAEAEFGKYGMNGIDIASISRRAGVSSQLVYHYFSNKNNLYAETLFRLTETFFSHYATLFITDKTPIESVHHFAYYFSAFFLEHPGMGRLVLDQVLREDPGPRRDLRADPRMRSVFAGLDSKIEEGVSAGIFKANVTVDRLFFITFVNTVGYTTLTDFVARMHFEKDEVCGSHDIRLEVAEAVVGSVINHGHFACPQLHRDG